MGSETSSRPPDPSAEEVSLRAEHDRLASRVAIRRSIDDVRRGAYGGFAFFIATSLSLKFAWDRWGWGPKTGRPPGKYPLLFLAALSIAIVLGAFTFRSFRRARLAMQVEDQDFARLKEIRRHLGVEP
ncbi:MAG: hypothetical protein WB493_04035 [Anaeromyxobacteraceae bacterium]